MRRYVYEVLIPEVHTVRITVEADNADQAIAFAAERYPGTFPKPEYSRTLAKIEWDAVRVFPSEGEDLPEDETA